MQDVERNGRHCARTRGVAGGASWRVATVVLCAVYAARGRPQVRNRDVRAHVRLLSLSLHLAVPLLTNTGRLGLSPTTVGVHPNLLGLAQRCFSRRESLAQLVGALQQPRQAAPPHPVLVFRQHDGCSREEMRVRGADELQLQRRVFQPAAGQRQRIGSARVQELQSDPPNGVEVACVFWRESLEDGRSLGSDVPDKLQDRSGGEEA